MTLTVGSLCSGYGGLDLALSDVLDTETIWQSEIEDNASHVIEQRLYAPNLGDLTKIKEPPKVDIVSAGFPCQPVSMAGYREGINDERWLIDDVCRVAVEADARWLVLENVRGLLTANKGVALGRVVEALALNGFTRWEWTTLPASAVGAPHKRDRWFCVATNPNRSTGEKPNVRNGDRNGSKGRLNRATESDAERFSFSGSSFERYQQSIGRWEEIIGRRSPEPYKDYRLNIWFVEWMMGLPEGWVCGKELGLKRTAILKLLGNGIVPLQGATALRFLFNNILEG